MKLKINDSISSRSCILKGLIASLLVLIVTGCAATSTTIVDEELVNNPKPMSFYKSLVIKQFSLDESLSEAPSSSTSSDERRYGKIPAQFAEQILRYVKSKNIYKEVSLNGTPTDATLVLKGKFTKMGRFRISYEAYLLDGASSEEVAYFRHTLWDVFDTTEGIGRLGREVANFIDRIQYK